MRDILLSVILTDLITFSESLLRGPQMQTRNPPRNFVELAAELQRRRAQPGQPSSGAAVVMITAIESFFAEQNDAWLMIAGCALPLLRREAWAALTAERARRNERIGEYR